VGLPADGNEYLESRLTLLADKLQRVESLASTEKPPDNTIENEVLSITPHKTEVPKEADKLENVVCVLRAPRENHRFAARGEPLVRLCAPLHASSNRPTHKDRPTDPFTIVLADAINLRLSKMAKSCPGSLVSQARYARAWHVRDETLRQGACRARHLPAPLPFAAHWGGGDLVTTPRHCLRR
jgi:hypothetical protein